MSGAKFLVSHLAKSFRHRIDQNTLPVKLMKAFPHLDAKERVNPETIDQPLLYAHSLMFLKS